MSNQIAWLFGRGASSACDISWEEPDEWKIKNRMERIRNIDMNLTQQMASIPTGSNVYSKLLLFLENNSGKQQKHIFITTNWDYLLQREIDSRNYSMVPEWLIDSQVFHLNGSIEKWGDARYRSPICLPEDNRKEADQKLEFKRALAEFIWSRTFIIIGLSFKHEVDRQLIEILRPHEDNCPFGGGNFLIINNCLADLNRTGEILKHVFPNAVISRIQLDFKSWVEMECPQILENNKSQKSSVV